MDFDVFTIALLVSSETPPALLSAEEDLLQDAHMAHLAELHGSGHLLAAGPVLGTPNRRLRGLSVLRGGVDESRGLVDRDPGVRAGVWHHELHSWMVPRGVVAFTPGRLPRSMAEAAGSTPASSGVTPVSVSFVCYVRAPAADVWQALTEPGLVSQWRFGMRFQTSWSPGARLRSAAPDGEGVVVESEPGQLLVYDWTADDPSMNAGFPSRVRFALDSVGETTRMGVRHDGLQAGSRFHEVVSEGWPMMLASLKSLLETGSALRFG